jgi:hypothetical protein
MVCGVRMSGIQRECRTHEAGTRAPGRIRRPAFIGFDLSGRYVTDVESPPYRPATSSTASAEWSRGQPARPL